MPDLMIQYHMWCPTNENWSTQVKSTTGKTYQVKYGKVYGRDYSHGYTCTCDAFKFGKGKECKHIVEAKAKHCQWNHEAVCGSSLKTPKNHKCPKCGESLVSIAIGV